MSTRDPIEIKLTLAGDVDAALDKLRPKDQTALRIWFLDDLTPGLVAPLPLQAAGVVLRLRAGGDNDDSTVKLRPCRRSQLAHEWNRNQPPDELENRVEGDWAGKKKVLAASSVWTMPAGTVTSCLAADDLRGLFRPEQSGFLDTCADLKVNPAGLTALGPIDAIKWKKVGLGPGIKARAERWSVGPLDFLELSIRSDPDDDPVADQSEFEAAVRRVGLDFAQSQLPKTKQVIYHLAGLPTPTP